MWWRGGPDTRAMKRIVYSCPYVPMELIATCGLAPSRVVVDSVGTEADEQTREGMCGFMRGVVTEVVAADAAGVVLTTVCDQMRRGCELVAAETSTPVFLMNVPSTWQSVAAQQLYTSELRRLGRFLVSVGGQRVTSGRLRDIMLEYDVRRSVLRGALGGLGAREAAEAIMGFNQSGGVYGVKETVDARRHGVPVALLGGPMTAQGLGILDVLVAAGATVALDGTETGERTLPRKFDRRRVQDDPLCELATAYFGSIPDAFKRPNSELYQWLKREVSERNIRGVVLVRHLWCDIWHAEKQRLREWLEIPLVEIDVGGQYAAGRIATRVQALVEAIK